MNNLFKAIEKALQGGVELVTDSESRHILDEYWRRKEIESPKEIRDTLAFSRIIPEESDPIYFVPLESDSMWFEVSTIDGDHNQVFFGENESFKLKNREYDFIYRQAPDRYMFFLICFNRGEFSHTELVAEMRSYGDYTHEIEYINPCEILHTWYSMSGVEMKFTCSLQIENEVNSLETIIRDCLQRNKVNVIEIRKNLREKLRDFNLKLENFSLVYKSAQCTESFIKGWSETEEGFATLRDLSSKTVLHVVKPSTWNYEYITNVSRYLLSSNGKEIKEKYEADETLYQKGAFKTSLQDVQEMIKSFWELLEG